MSNYSLRSKPTNAPEPVPPVSQETPEPENTTDTKSDTLTPPAVPTTPTTPPKDAETARSPKDDSSSSSDDESLPPRQFWDGNIPQANGTLAKLFTHADTRANNQTHEDLVAFLYDKEDNKGNKLQFDNNLITFLTAIPGTKRKVRVVYGIGTGIGLTGIKSNKLEDKILALSGEFENGNAYPTVLQYPSSALTPTKQKAPFFENFERHLTEGNKNSTWFKYGDLQNTATLPMLVPVPTRFICDGFDEDLDAAVIFERLSAISAEEATSLKATLHLLRTFLTAVVVKYNQKDPTILPPPQTFMVHPSPLINKWKKQRVDNLFPSLHNTPNTTATTSPATSPTIAATPKDIPTVTQTTNADWSPEAFIKAFNAMQTSSATTNDLTKDASNTSETLGMGTFAYDLLLNLSGLAHGTADELLPMWSQLAEKNLSKSDKLTFVRRSIENNIKWSESKVLPLNTLLTMIVTRAWEGETTLSSLTSAAKGLTPFAVPCLTEAEVTSQNDLADAIDAASNTTVKDHSSSKLRASAPASFDGLVKRIKRFGNLLFAVFGENSALFMQIEDMITALDSYGEHARTTMSHQTIASILWITHLQARHYSAGAMKGATALKAEFTTMMNAIVTKAPVIHMDTPPNLYVTYQEPSSLQKRSAPNPTPSPYESPNKNHKPNDGSDRFQLVDRNVMNAKMKTAMAPILSLPRIPNMGKLCRAARTNAGELFPSHKDICIRSQVLGKCFVSCTHKHIKLSDRDVEPALKILESVIANPSLIKVN